MKKSVICNALPVAAYLSLLGIGGCKPDLIVRDPAIIWTDASKMASAVITNRSTADAGAFLVYFDAEENPVSSNHRPQVVHNVPGLSKGASIQLKADFARLSHPDNHGLRNVRQVRITADPKQMVKEDIETNNTTVIALPPKHNCFAFEPPLAAGTHYGSSAGHTPGQVILSTPSGVHISLQNFLFIGPGNAFNDARIGIPPVAFASGQAISLNNIDLECDFTGIGIPVTRLDIRFMDLGGFENLSVNGAPAALYRGDITTVPSPLGGVNITVASAPVAGGKAGVITFEGPIQRVRIGGQELWIDDVCYANQ